MKKRVKIILAVVFFAFLLFITGVLGTVLNALGYINAFVVFFIVVLFVGASIFAVCAVILLYVYLKEKEKQLK